MKKALAEFFLQEKVKTFYLQKAYRKSYFGDNGIVHARPEKSMVSIVTYEEVFCSLFSNHLFVEKIFWDIARWLMTGTAAGWQVQQL